MQSGFGQILRVPGSVTYLFSYNLGTIALSDMYVYALSLWACSPWASGIRTYQTKHSCPICYNLYIRV